MKTKANKVPLVGPKGRRELLDRIEELEKKVIELESAPKNESHLLEILSTSNGDVPESTALSLLKLDGKAVTYNDLKSINMCNTIAYNEGLDTYMAIQNIVTNDSDRFIHILGGAYVDGGGGQFWIRIDGDDSWVRLYDL